LKKTRFKKQTDLKPIKGIEVVPKFEGEDFDKILKRFRKKVVKSGILKEAVKRMAYKKPSDKKRKEKKQNILRNLKRQNKIEEIELGEDKLAYNRKPNWNRRETENKNIAKENKNE